MIAHLQKLTCTVILWYSIVLYNFYAYGIYDIQLYVDLGPDLTEMFTMWGTLSKLMDDDYISISTYILNDDNTCTGQDSSSTLKLEGYKDAVVIIASDISLGGKP